MKLSFYTIKTAFLCVFVSACGGGGGGDSSPAPVATQPPPATCTAATTTDRYAASSYDSCRANSNDLTGIWVITSDYVVETSSLERTLRQRSVMTISKNNDGTLNAATCNADATKRNVTFNASANSLQIFDRAAGTSIQLSITSNTAMQGSHLSAGSVLVQRSAVSAKKIRDLTTDPISQVLVNYASGLISMSPATVDCFTQAQGITRLIALPITLDGEEIYFFQPVEYNGHTELLEANLYIPTNANDDTEVSLKFLDSNVEIEGEAPANSTSPQTVITMDKNDNTLLTFVGSMVDEIDSSKHAEFSFAYILGPL